MRTYRQHLDKTGTYMRHGSESVNESESGHDLPLPEQVFRHDRARASWGSWVNQQRCLDEVASRDSSYDRVCYRFLLLSWLRQREQSEHKGRR